jgi:hypothetical protein
MKRGGKFLVSTTAFAVVACGGQQGKLEIRSTPTPLAEMKRAVPERIAEARGQLALGNVALALTSFRIAAREDPNSIDALAGIADCYDRMSRFDSSRRYYESALALAPANTQLLAAFAASLQLQGKSAEALSVREEISARVAASAALESASMAEVEAVAPLVQVAAAEVKPAASAKAPPPAPSTVVPEANAAPVPPSKPKADPKPLPKPEIRVAAVEPQAAPAPLGPSVTIKLPPPRRVQQQPVAAAPAALPARSTWAAVEPGVASAPLSAPQPVPVNIAPEFASVALLRPIEERVPEPSIAQERGPLAAPQPVPVNIPSEFASVALLRPVEERIPEPSIAEERGPRIERMSTGEIALITVSKPEWRSTTVASSQRSSKVRFVPLRQARLSPVKVRLLNAARVDRLAARTRTWLSSRGFRGLAIGDAQATRRRSVILYPAAQREMAQRLSAQFGFPLSRRASGSHVVVLLGADAARMRPLQPKRA